jgi:type IV secretion system protein TrbL
MFRRARATLGIILFIIIVAAPAHAQTAVVLDQVVTQFRTQATAWEDVLRGFALNTFAILAVIELAWAAIRLAFRGADFSEWLAEIVNQIMFLGFFLALLENSVTWSQAIVDSFRQAAGSAGGAGVAPSDVFAIGVNLAQKVMAQMSIWAPAASVGLIIAGLVVEVCFALIAAFMVLALVESYLVISMGVIFMAFGGSRWTSDLAVSTIRYTISVGAKLFVLQLLVSIGAGMISQWSAAFTDLVMLALVKVLPETMQRIVNGSSMASGSALTGAAAAVGGATGAFAAGMVGAAPMAHNAAQLASAQLGQMAEQGTAPQSRIGRAAALTGYTARNMATAPLTDLGRRLGGQYGARHGNPTWRMSADLANRRRLLEEDGTRPRRPASPTDPGNSIG